MHASIFGLAWILQSFSLMQAPELEDLKTQYSDYSTGIRTSRTYIPLAQRDLTVYTPTIKFPMSDESGE
jgi:hypothetical protein